MDISLCRSTSSTDGNAALILIPDFKAHETLTNCMVSSFESEIDSYLVNGDSPDAYTVSSYADRLSEEMAKHGLKWATIFGIGTGASVAQALAVNSSRLVRRLVLLDATARLAPSKLIRAIDRLERYLPAGLPFRSLSRQFDSRSMLHRIHCPTLVIVSKSASLYTEEQGRMIALRIPNAWMTTLQEVPFSNGDMSEELAALIRNFIDVPVKRPQKRLRASPKTS